MAKPSKIFGLRGGKVVAEERHIEPMWAELQEEETPAEAASKPMPKPGKIFGLRGGKVVALEPRLALGSRARVAARRLQDESPEANVGGNRLQLEGQEDSAASRLGTPALRSLALQGAVAARASVATLSLTAAPEEPPGEEDWACRRVPTNSMGLPLRPDKESCPMFLRFGSCRQGNLCSKNHPEEAVAKHKSAAPGPLRLAVGPLRRPDRRATGQSPGPKAETQDTSRIGRICPECSFAVPIGHAFCGKCGSKV